jgi:multisubunit Na+/H+ antiporter MnhE subunit
MDGQKSMNFAIWVLGLIVGFAFLFVMFRIAGLSGPNQRERPPRWLLVVGIVIMAGGLVLLVIAARSDR